ncbi:hypothetical protein [uncultured Sphaerochaeta sp.]|uniref:hypothetical protein n=1 Tax=uncultured Sphaerochaeta sp. TaxID=886478 RepID=UPI002A0A9044|nr:hypothetical protein [uncultured Sphaerochaeta sp.]
MFALVVTFLTGRKLGSVNAVNRGVAGDVPAEIDRARCSVEGSAGHAEHSTESIAAVLRNLGASEAAGNRSLDGISESRGISERIQELDSENDAIVLELARRSKQADEGDEDERAAAIMEAKRAAKAYIRDLVDRLAFYNEWEEE